ncbi:MAG: hypothetical protein ABR548_08115 [Actinomycetota bacterium]
MRRALVFALAAFALLAPLPSRADASFTKPFDGVDQSTYCTPPDGSTCTATPGPDAVTGATRADVVLDTGARTVGYGAGNAMALVYKTMTLDADVLRLPVRAHFTLDAASAHAGPLHATYEQVGTGSSLPDAEASLWIRVQRVGCSYSRTVRRVVASSDSSVPGVSPGAVEMSAMIADPCDYSYGSADHHVRKGTYTIEAGAFVYAELGYLTFDPDIGVAEAHVDARVEAIDVGTYVPPAPRTETSTYGTTSLSDHPCSYPLFGGFGHLDDPNIPGPCFAVGADETRVSRITVTDDSGRTQAFTVTFVDEAGYTIGYQEGGYQATYCGSLPSALYIPPGAAFARVSLGDANYPGYGTAPKCRGLVPTQGTVVAEFA